MADAKIVELWKAGLSDKEIGKQVGRTPRAVRSHRRRHGYTFRDPKLDREWLKRESGKAWSYAEAGDGPGLREEVVRLAEVAGRHPDHVRKILHEMGMPRVVRKYTPEELAEGKRLLDTGMPYSEASRMTDISYHVLQYHFPGMGLAPKDKYIYNEAKKLEREMGLSL